jgi:hypothetical protein
VNHVSISGSVNRDTNTINASDDQTDWELENWLNSVGKQLLWEMRHSADF